MNTSSELAHNRTASTFANTQFNQQDKHNQTKMSNIFSNLGNSLLHTQKVNLRDHLQANI